MKKYIIIGSVAVLAFSFMSFIKAKASKAKEVFEKIILKIGFPKNFDISTTRIRFYIDIILQNPTAQDFTASSGNVIRAKMYRVYRGAELLAHGTLGGINGVELPAGGSYTFKDIYIEIPTMDFAKQVLNLTGGFGSLKYLASNLFSKDKKDTNATQNFVNNLKGNSQKFLNELRYEVDIEGFGLLYTFKQNVL